MNLYPKNKMSQYEVNKSIVVFYIVGVLGFIIPFTKDFFIAITPLALLLNTYLLAIYHKKYDLKSIGVFAFIFLAGFFIEVIGVNTGLIFGYYKYGSGLGFKLFETPLLIGVNWLFLTYASASLLREFKINKNISILLVPLLMLVYDLVLEQVAPKMDMWSWQHNSVPLQNYVAWFVIALIFSTLLRFLKINLENHLSKVLFACQFAFLVVLMFVLG